MSAEAMVIQMSREELKELIEDACEAGIITREHNDHRN